MGGGENPNPKTSVRMDTRYIQGKVDVVGDAKDLSMFNDGEFDGVYARHVLEHWSYRETREVLLEWGRVIKPGGTLEIHCPDLDKLIHCYLSQIVDGYTGKRFDTQLFVYYLYGDQSYKDNTHKAGWNFESLSAILRSVGFTTIERQKQYEDHLEMRIVAKK